MKLCFQQNQFYANAKFPRIKNFNPLQNKLKKYSSSLVKFIMEALIIDPNKRATSSELLQHEFFTQNSWIDEFQVKLKNIVALYEASLSTSIATSSTSNHTNKLQILQSDKTNNNVSNQSTTKPVNNNANKTNQTNHVLKINVKNPSTLTKSIELNSSLNNKINKDVNNTNNQKNVKLF